MGWHLDVVIEWIAIAISLVAIGFSVLTWIKLRPDEQKKYESTMVALTKLLINKKIKIHKTNVSFWYWNRKDRSEPVYFENSKYAENAQELENAFNQVAKFYERNLVDKEWFREIFGGTLVRFWRILEDEILLIQKKNPDFCIHFQKVSKKFMEKYKIIGEPYRTKPSLPNT